MDPNLDLKQKKKLVHTSAPTQLKSYLCPYLFPTKRMGALKIKESIEILSPSLFIPNKKNGCFGD